jgi:hypothetical protein
MTALNDGISLIKKVEDDYIDIIKEKIDKISSEMENSNGVTQSNNLKKYKYQFLKHMYGFGNNINMSPNHIYYIIYIHIYYYEKLNEKLSLNVYGKYTSINRRQISLIFKKCIDNHIPSDVFLGFIKKNENINGRYDEHRRILSMYLNRVIDKYIIDRKHAAVEAFMDAIKGLTDLDDNVETHVNIPKELINSLIDEWNK